MGFLQVSIGTTATVDDHPNTDLIPGLTMTNVTKGSVVTNEWFEFLKEKKLRTYFNDHPFPVANQTTPKEVVFRYNGLSEWIGRGLSYWWFDHVRAPSLRRSHSLYG